MSKCRWIEDHEFKNVNDNTIKRFVYKVGVGFYGTHQTSWYFLTIDINC
jgi:hypothetical protein